MPRSSTGPAHNVQRPGRGFWQRSGRWRSWMGGPPLDYCSVPRAVPLMLNPANRARSVKAPQSFRLAPRSVSLADHARLRPRRSVEPNSTIAVHPVCLGHTILPPPLVLGRWCRLGLDVVLRDVLPRDLRVRDAHCRRRLAASGSCGISTLGNASGTARAVCRDWPRGVTRKGSRWTGR